MNETEAMKTAKSVLETAAKVLGVSDKISALLDAEGKDTRERQIFEAVHEAGAKADTLLDAFALLHDYDMPIDMLSVVRRCAQDWLGVAAALPALSKTPRYTPPAPVTTVTNEKGETSNVLTRPCTVCTLPIGARETRIGTGGGDGVSYAHALCFYRHEYDKSRVRIAELERQVCSLEGRDG